MWKLGVQYRDAGLVPVKHHEGVLSSKFCYDPVFDFLGDSLVLQVKYKLLDMDTGKCALDIQEDAHYDVAAVPSRITKLCECPATSPSLKHVHRPRSPSTS
jgi:hypothetical protein